MTDLGLILLSTPSDRSSWPRSSAGSSAWQVGAAAAGGSGLSALIGLLIDRASLAILGPAILTLALLLVVAHAALTRLAPIAPGRLRRARRQNSNSRFPERSRPTLMRPWLPAAEPAWRPTSAAAVMSSRIMAS
jgi:hypothetical protein